MGHFAAEPSTNPHPQTGSSRSLGLGLQRGFLVLLSSGRGQPPSSNPGSTRRRCPVNILVFLHLRPSGPLWTVQVIGGLRPSVLAERWARWAHGGHRLPPCTRKRSGHPAVRRPPLTSPPLLHATDSCLVFFGSVVNLLSLSSNLAEVCIDAIRRFTGIGGGNSTQHGYGYLCFSPWTRAPSCASLRREDDQLHRVRFANQIPRNGVIT